MTIQKTMQMILRGTYVSIWLEDPGTPERPTTMKWGGVRLWGGSAEMYNHDLKETDYKVVGITGLDEDACRLWVVPADCDPKDFYKEDK